MPWTPKQHRLFEAAAHNPAVAKKIGIPRAKAALMAKEGIKKTSASKTPRVSAAALAQALMRTP